MSDPTKIINSVSQQVIGQVNDTLNNILDKTAEQSGYNDYVNKQKRLNFIQQTSYFNSQVVKPAYIDGLKAIRDIHDKINNYNNIMSEVDIYKRLKQRKDRELDIIKNRLNNYKRHYNRDNRNSINENKKNKTYKFILTIILVAYYVAFGVILLSSGFIGKELYKNKKIILLCIFYITLPLYLDYLLNLINNFIVWIKEQLMILKPELSYNDIIKYEDLINYIDYSDKNESIN
tara:strand:- start:1320 stop:2018 length:699 start_codon:yes stop_codon:yes gene_type:complete